MRHHRLSAMRAPRLLSMMLLATAIGNYFTLPFFYGVDFMFGSIAVLMTMRLFGLGWGLLAALIAGLLTFHHWQYPLGIPIFLSEAFFVGWLMRRVDYLPLVDVIFWLIIGMPMIWLLFSLFQDLPRHTLRLMVLSSSINGIFNAMIAGILLLVLPWKRWYNRDFRMPAIKAGQVMFYLMASSLFFPAILLILINGRFAQQQIETQALRKLDGASHEITLHILAWSQRHFVALQELGKIAMESNMRPSPKLDLLTTFFRKTFPDVKIAYIGSKSGTSLVFSPSTDDRGRSNLGRHYADRPYFKQMFTEKKPVVSDVYIGRVANVPVVSLSVPLIQNNMFLGYTYASIEAARLRELLGSTQNDKDFRAILLDSSGRVISSTDRHLNPLQFYGRFNRSQNSAAENEIFHFPLSRKNINIMEKLHHSFYGQQRSLGPDLPWHLFIEIPVAKQVLALQSIYIKDFGILLIITFSVFVLSWLASLWMNRPLTQLTTLTHNLPDKISQGEKIAWPHSRIIEIGELIMNFRLMTRILNRKFGDLRKSQDTLEEKTINLESLNKELESEICERKLTEERLNHLAHHDPLTDLPNRFLFIDRLYQAMNFARRHNFRVAILFLDIDRFKIINDSLGHHAGDMLLQQIAQRISESIRAQDTVARLGGDEFLLVLSEMGSQDDAEISAQKILRSFAFSFQASGHEVFLTASIGISLFPNDGEEVDDLIKNADIAMYQAKKSGRNTYQRYRPEMSSGAHRRLSMENQLRKAIVKDELQVFYQPQICLHTNRIVSTEALLRWEHRELGFISPADFIPIAEETGLIAPLGEWVLRNACRQTQQWRNKGHELMVSVNLSGRQLDQSDFIELVQTVLVETGLDPSALELELTESILMQNTEGTVKIMQALKQIGVQFALDDFGTGYSSLSYLKLFPINKLKIDQSFVRDITLDPNDAAIASTIIAMAHTLGMRVNAEGVESREQLDFLQAHACDEVQGYYFSKPLPGPALEAFLISHSAAHLNDDKPS